jgi:uncharacterized repeat protein (TIGR03806 family)
MRAAVAVAALAGCPGPETADTDTDVAFGLDERPENPTCRAWAGAPPERLSETGCVDRDHPESPGSGFVPYFIHSELWSDDAVKSRYLAVPDGGALSFAEDGDVEFPVGTVLGKWFEVDGALLEVRLLSRRSTGWVGVSYRWDADLGDGVRMLDGGTVPRDDGAPWVFPSTYQCDQCHGVAAGGSLGVEAGQLDGVFRYPNGVVADQLATLDHIAMLAEAPPDVPRLVDPGVRWGGLDRRARSYLHANCSGCHRPQGGTVVDLDLRYATPLSATNLCNPAENTFGLDGMSRITPGDVEHSMVHHRMTTPDVRMPPLGTEVVDDVGAALIADWIRSLDGCGEAP